MSDMNIYTETLLNRPLNKSTQRIFVAATRMNEGKTTTCLGLFEALRALYSRVGFIKPVGQRVMEVHGHKIDEDSFLLDSVFDVRVPIEAMSPIAVDSHFTREYLDNPTGIRPLLVDRICKAFDRSAYEKDITIIEGTGHAGVGAVFDLSNAAVAQILEAKVILVSEGGIGRPVDEVAMNKALFDQYGVEVLGVILNKVLPDKMAMVKEYAEKGLRRIGVKLLGAIPLQKELGFPSLGQIVAEIDGRWLNARESGGHERIKNVVIGAMTARTIVDILARGRLIIVPGDREDIIFSVVANAGISGDSPISGIILTSDMMPNTKMMQMVERTNIPFVLCKEDSYTIASKIHSMTVKTQPWDNDKIPLIKRLILDNIDIRAIFEAFQRESLLGQFL